MEKKRLERFAAILAARRAELLRSLAEVKQAGRANQLDQIRDEGDRANESQEREILFRQGAETRRSLAALELALARIRDGTFGECLNCEQEINRRRLEVLPWTRYCITCQELIEGQR